MRDAMRIAVLTLFLAAAAFAADDKPAVKEIPTKGLKIAFPKGGKPTEPTEIKTTDELAKSATLKDAADEIKKQVNFDKEKLVFFACGGSGRDKITPDEKTAGTFTLTRGLTRDYRMHTKLFVVPKETAVKIVTAK
jgi:hypothetical protein